MTENLKQPKVLYLCDLHRCDKCSPECRHTSDISHAVSFHVVREGVYEQEAVACRWISTKEALPPVFEPVLLCRRYRDGRTTVEAGTRDVGGWWKVYGHKVKTVTHWMSMPAPPEEGEE